MSRWTTSREVQLCKHVWKTLSGNPAGAWEKHISHMCWECQQKHCQYRWNGEGYKKFSLFPRLQCWLQLTRNLFFFFCGASKHLLENIDIVLGMFFFPATDLLSANRKPRRDLDYRHFLMMESLAFLFQWWLHGKSHCVCGLCFVCLLLWGYPFTVHQTDDFTTILEFCSGPLYFTAVAIGSDMLVHLT